MSATEQSPSDRFCEFFNQYYRDEIAELAQKYPNEQRSLWIEAKDLFTYDVDMLDDWRAQPSRMRREALDGLQLVDLPIDIDLSRVAIRLTDSHEYVPTRGVSELTSDDIGNYIGVTGHMAKVTGTTPRLVEAVFQCQRCGVNNAITQGRNSLQQPHECQGCQRQGPFLVDPSQSEFIDQRKIKFESPPDEGAPGQGQTITVHVSDELCHYGGENGLPDRAGERVTIYGQLEIDESQFDKRNASPEMETWFNAQAIEFEQDDYDDLDIEAHREAFEGFAERDDAIDLCAQSIAPELRRDPDDDLSTVTEAAVAWLFNAYRLDPDGMGQKRGDLHMGIFGDPGLGKSTLLSDLSNLSPKCEFRSGTGLSAVGLTAAAVQEEFAGTSEWTLEPGVLPRANGGHCIIDEVDDVVDEKTKKMHDALEGDQMVKVDKAGISADLPTRTALLMSGNPVYGRFDRFEPIAQQIDLDPALVSRMDVLFALQDDVDKDADSSKAEHILSAYDELSEAELTGNTPEGDSAIERPIPTEVFRAWVAYARENVFPRLSDEAKECLMDFYLEARNLNDGHTNSNDGDDPIPATPRTLESGIRLSTAFARVHLSDTIEKRHAERAIAISRKVVGLNFDPKAGQMDAGMTDTGKPKSEHDRMKLIKETIDELAADADDGRAQHDALVDVLETQGLDASRAEQDIENLRKSGSVYGLESEGYRTP